MPHDTPNPQPSVIPLEPDPTIVKIHLHACIAALRDEDGRVKTRELSLAVTKLQEATMWIDEHLRQS